VAAGSVITKDVPANSLAIARERQTVIEDWVTNEIKKAANKNIGSLTLNQ
jgi:bifunctional UDP-N-acetylglucosamine pyrophosphorylase/glucosamine-1-phosphate N-acetyltransferase